MALTELGFNRVTYEEALETIIERTKLLFGEDIDTSENSTIGKIIRLYCSDVEENQELAESIYLSTFPNTAIGVNLDRVAKLVGISRNAATFAEHEITITGTAGSTVEMGFLVSSGDVIFHTVNNYIIESEGTVVVTVECNEAGIIGNVPLGAIDTIVNPSANVTEISHTDVIKLASDVETDHELRSRIALAGSTGSGTIDAVRSVIMRVEGVESVYIEENSTNSTVGNLPPHSFQCFVFCPQSAEQAVAEAIFSQKPLGIDTYGDKTYTVTDLGGGSHSINFSKTEEVQIYVKCAVTVSSSLFDTQIIKDNIVNRLSKYSNGQDVTATSLYSEVYVDSVLDVTQLEISTDGTNYSTEPIEISNSQVVRIEPNNITITVTV